MIEVGGLLAIAAAVVVAAAAGVNRLLHVYLAQRMLLQLERQRAKCEAGKSRQLVRLVGNRCATVRIVERDSNGFRLIEVDNQERTDRRAA